MLDSTRSGLWTTAGVLGVAGGGLFSLASAGMLVIAIVADGPVRGAHSFPGVMPLLYASARILPALFLFAGLLAVGAGVGLLRRRSYGRSLALAFCVLGIAWFGFVLVHLWLGAFSRSADVSFFFRVAPAVFVTPVALGVGVALALFFRVLRAHPNDFPSRIPGA